MIASKKAKLFASLALYCTGHSFLKSFAFTIWVFAFVAASMFYPSAFGKWFGVDLKVLIVSLIQIITFGMGTTLSATDFSRVFIMPVPVFIGFFLQFAVMLHNGIGYLLGYWTARAFKLDETSCRTISFEVGMQNGGMATGLAMEVLKSTSAALAPAIFGP